MTSGSDQGARRSIALGYGACALAGGLWSTGFLFGKIALRSMNSDSMVLYRFLFACVALLPVLRRPQFSRREWSQLLIASLLGVPVQFLTQFYGLSLTTVSHAALMVGVMPGILALGATVFAGERLPKLGWLALAGSSVGVALIVLSKSGRPAAEGGPTLPGDLLIVLSLTISLGWLLLNQSLVRRHSALQVTAWGLLAGTLMLVAWVLAKDGLSPGAWRAGRSLVVAGGKWRAVHRGNQPAVELGYAARAGFACGSVSEYRAGTWLRFGSLVPG